LADGAPSLPPPRDESLQELVAWAADVLRLVLQQQHNQAVVLAGHDSVNRALLAQILNQPLSAYWRLVLDPCGVSEIDFDDGEPWVHRVNETLHLAGVTEAALPQIQQRQPKHHSGKRSLNLNLRFALHPPAFRCLARLPQEKRITGHLRDGWASRR
jgi:hypothetical protein